MPVPRYETVRDTPLPTDAELVPYLRSMLGRPARRQVWIMLLDSESRPLPIVIPSDVGPEPDPDDVSCYADALRSLSQEFDGATLVLTFERPGPADLVDNDRRWLRLLHEVCAESEFSSRGPYLLLGREVRAIPVEDYAGMPWGSCQDGGDPEYDDHGALRASRPAQ